MHESPVTLGDLAKYEYVVVGSGFAAFAFIDEILRLDKDAKILCAERGDAETQLDAEDTEYQTKQLFGDVGDEDIPYDYPWKLSKATAASEGLNSCAGTSHVLGGRSNFWYGWCMQPTLQQLRDFPSAVLETCSDPKFWQEAHELLGVRSITDLKSASYPALQSVIDGCLTNLAENEDSITNLRPAAFAQGDEAASTFVRFSAAQRLIGLTKAYTESDDQYLDILLHHEVRQLQSSPQSSHVNQIETGNGTLQFDNPNVKFILCAGAIPNTALMLKSFRELRQLIGTRISGHFRTHVFAKVPASSLRIVDDEDLDQRTNWGLGAKVVCGQDSTTGLQWHIQFSAFYCPDYEGRYGEIVSKLPRYGTAPVERHLENLGHDILISCATLGELCENNVEAWCRLSDPDDAASNVELQFSLTESDRSLWDTMDEATFRAIEVVASELENLKYWSEQEDKWVKRKPSQAERRSTILVHEASTTPMGNNRDLHPVDEYYKVRGTSNVFVTGSNTLPTAGSWNPTLTICGLAQEVARKLAGNKTSINDETF